jgi:cytoskeletal protein RodZ
MTDTGILGVRSWRQRRGITLEAIAASTKLSIRQLKAIEAGDFKRLPGGIYNTSYIKQYAQAIGFDESELLAFYQDWVNPAPASPVKSRPAPRISGTPASELS